MTVLCLQVDLLLVTCVCVCFWKNLLNFVCNPEVSRDVCLLYVIDLRSIFRFVFSSFCFFLYPFLLSKCVFWAIHPFAHCTSLHFPSSLDIFLLTRSIYSRMTSAVVRPVATIINIFFLTSVFVTADFLTLWNTSWSFHDSGDPPDIFFVRRWIKIIPMRPLVLSYQILPVDGFCSIFNIYVIFFQNLTALLHNLLIQPNYLPGEGTSIMTWRGCSSTFSKETIKSCQYHDRCGSS